MALPTRSNGIAIIAQWFNDIKAELESYYPNKYVEDLVFNGSQNSKIVDVTDKVSDAQTCITSLLEYDAGIGWFAVDCQIRSLDADTIVVFTHINLPAGTYRLIVLG